MELLFIFLFYVLEMHFRLAKPKKNARAATKGAATNEVSRVQPRIRWAFSKQSCPSGKLRWQQFPLRVKLILPYLGICF